MSCTGLLSFVADLTGIPGQRSHFLSHAAAGSCEIPFVPRSDGSTLAVLVQSPAKLPEAFHIFCPAGGEAAASCRHVKTPLEGRFPATGKQNPHHLVLSEANAKREQMFEERAALRKTVTVQTLLAGFRGCRDFMIWKPHRAEPTRRGGAGVSRRESAGMTSHLGFLPMEKKSQNVEKKRTQNTVSVKSQTEQ